MIDRAKLELEYGLDRIAHFIARHLPRRIVQWAYIRVSMDGYPPAPGEVMPVERTIAKPPSGTDIAIRVIFPCGCVAVNGDVWQDAGESAIEFERATSKLLLLAIQEAILAQRDAHAGHMSGGQVQ